MSTLALAARDSSTMLRRNLKRMLRYPSLTLMLVGIPVVFLLLFVYILGGTLGDGLGGGGGRDAYANYVLPGILLITVAGTAQGTAIAIAMDMTEGIVARFKTMSIWRPSVLAGHVIGTVIQTVIALVLVLAVGLLVGFRPQATPLEWLAAAGLLVGVTFAVTWFSVACGLAAKSVETASNLPMPLLLLPFLGSGFVPTESLPAAVRYVAEYQPFTPFIETLRGLLLGTGIGANGWLAAAWIVAIAAGCYLWSRRLYNRDPSS